MRHRPWLQAEHSLVGGPQRNSRTWEAGACREAPEREDGRGAKWGSAHKATLAEPSQGRYFISQMSSVGAGPLSHSLLYQEQFLEDRRCPINAF